MLDQLRTNLANLWNQNRSQLVYGPVDVNQVDYKNDYIALTSGKHYLRMWLTQAFLSKKVQFMTNWFPAVHSLIKFDFQESKIEFPTVADTSKVNFKIANDQGDVIAQNYVLTPLIPFNGGTVELDAGLLALQGASYLNSFITTLSDFSGLLAVPQFSAALSIADPLAKGLQSLLGLGGVQLALHDGFADGRMGGYWVAVRATPAQVDPAYLVVYKDQLWLRDKNNLVNASLLEGYDFMLFRIEVTEKGPHYSGIGSIQDPMKQAHQALKDQDVPKADGFYRAAIIAVHEAKELTIADRRRVKSVLAEDYKELKEALGYSGLAGESKVPLLDGQYDLSTAMERAISVDQALNMVEPSFEELMAV